MDSEKLLRVVGLGFAALGVIFTVAAFVTDIRVLWTIGPGLLGSGIAFLVLFETSKAG